MVERGGFRARKAEAETTTMASISKEIHFFLKPNADTHPQNSVYFPTDCLVYWLRFWSAMREVPGSNPV